MEKSTAFSERDDQRESGRSHLREILADLVCTNTSLRRAARRLAQLYDGAMAPAGLKATQISLLSQIALVHDAGHPEGPTLQSLAESLAVSTSGLTHALRPLVRDGLVELRPDPHDGRTKTGALTARGEALLSDALFLWADVNQRVEEVLGSSAPALRTLADDVASAEFLEAYQTRRPLRA